MAKLRLPRRHGVSTLAIGFTSIAIPLGVNGQEVSDSLARARGEQMSVCPAVVRADNGPIDGKTLSVSPFFLFAGKHQIGIGLTSGTPISGMVGTISTIVAISMTAGAARYSARHDLTVIADDSIRLAPATRYDDRSGRPDFHLESLSAQLSMNDLRRLGGAKNIAVRVGPDSFPLKTGQVQAIRAFVRETLHPTSDGNIATGCGRATPTLSGGDTVRAGAILIRRQGADQLIAVPLDRPVLPLVDITASDSAHLPRGVYLASQVDVPVRMPDGKPVLTELPPEVIAAFGAQAVEEFIVNTDGTIDQATFKVLRAPDTNLAAALARSDRSGVRFRAAELHGKKVRQLVRYVEPVMIERPVNQH